MTHISPRHQREMADRATAQLGWQVHNFATMAAADTSHRRRMWLREVLILSAIILTAALAGYLLGCAQSTAAALPQIITQSQALAAW